MLCYWYLFKNIEKTFFLNINITDDKLYLNVKVYHLHKSFNFRNKHFLKVYGIYSDLNAIWERHMVNHYKTL